MIALSGAALAALGERATLARQREKEAELAFRGEAIKRAIDAYWNASPGAAKQLPHALADLTEDRRGIAVVRHLRRVYKDPFDPTGDWEILYADDGIGIRGVHSRSTAIAYNIVGLPFAPAGTPRKVLERLFVFESTASQPAAAVSGGRPIPPRSP